MDSLFRKLPLFKGKERLARFLLKDSIATKKNIWVKGKYNCEYFLPNVLESIGFKIFINGIYEEETSSFFAERMPANGVFLDLGANIGAVTIPLHQKRKDIKTICVEAAPWIFTYLQKNISRNNVQNVQLINKVLFYSDNEEVNFYSSDLKFGTGSLSPVFTDKVVKVNTIKIDSLIKEFQISKVDMIKIDVEGYEYHVFKGATELLSSEDSPDILFEFVDWAESKAKGIAVGDSQRILREMGYKLFYFDESLKDLKEVEGILTKGFFMLYATKKQTTK
ncbi:MAG TPA: FkbM family methyltransferase [Puia sp.]|nr:FkbM family methyltransferase [Puia sp.]